MNITNDDLNYILSHGILNEDDVLNQMKEMKKKEILALHNQRIWQGKDGRWKTYLPDSTKPKNRKLIAKATKAALHDAIIDYYTTSMNPPTKYTFRDMFEEWHERHSSTVVTGTLERIEVDFNKFYKTAYFVDKDITTLNAYDLEYWLEKQISDYGLNKTAFYNMATILKNTLIHAYKSGKLSYDLWKDINPNTNKVSTPSKAKSETQVFNHEERRLLMKQAMTDYKNNPDYIIPLMILLCDQLGLRNGELCTLKPTDIVDNGNSIWIQRQESKEHDKNKKLIKKVVEYTKSDAGTRKLYLVDKAKKILSYLPKDQEYLFEMNHKRVTCSQTDAYIRKLCKKVNIPVRSMHKIRKTYISTLFAVGLHPEDIRLISGHSDLETLYKNYCFSIETEESKIKKLIAAS